MRYAENIDSSEVDINIRNKVFKQVNIYNNYELDVVI